MAAVKIRLSKSCIGPREKAAVEAVLGREYLGMGAEVEQFESALTKFFGRPAVCVNTGTAALQLAIQALRLEPGDEVLVQSLTFIATFQAISAAGATAVPCEVDPKTLTIDLNDAAKRLTPRTKVIVPMHYSGGVGNLKNVYDFAAKYTLRVVEDAAHAFGTEYAGQRVGSFGDIACFSFDGIKTVTSGEGGAVVTSDPEILRQVRDTRLLGVEKDSERRYAGERSWEFDVRAQGWRYHMSNIMAAIGIAQLDRFAEFSAKRRELAARYRDRLGNIEALSMLELDYELVVPHIMVVLLNLAKREDLRQKLSSKGIETGFHYKPNHMLSFYKNNTRVPLPVTEEIYPKLLSLPLHPDLTFEDVDYVCDALIESVG